MKEFLHNLELALALCRQALAEADDPETIRTLRLAIAEIEEVVRLAREGQRTSKAGH